MKNLLFTILLLIGMRHEILGQTMPSPASSTSIKNINIPVSMYNGVASVSVPLYEATAKNGASIPVALQYNTSGIRVAETAGPAGLGWQLMAGGKITRVLMGMPDELTDNKTGVTRDILGEMLSNLTDGEKDLFYF